MDLIEKYLVPADPELAEAIRGEEKRQQEKLELIASENFTSQAVMAAQGSVLTNKYAEGYPGRRYYGGCEYVDVAEDLAINRAKEIFGAEHVNVQPHSGTQANTAVYFQFETWGPYFRNGIGTWWASHPWIFCKFIWKIF